MILFAGVEPDSASVIDLVTEMAKRGKLEKKFLNTKISRIHLFIFHVNILIQLVDIE